MSRLPFEIMLALRYLRPKRTFVSVITLISIIGVTVGVAVLIIVISVMAGFDHQLREKLLGFSAHLRVVQETPMENYAEVIHLIKSHPEVKGVAPYVIGPVMVETQPEDGSAPLFLSAMVRGIDPEREENISTVLSSIQRGAADLRGNRILVGNAFAANLNITVGDRLLIYSVRDFRRFQETMRKAGDGGSLDEAYLPTEYEIAGVFDVGYYEFNESFIVTSLENAQDMYDLGDSAQGVIVMLHDPEKAREVRQQIGPMLGTGYYIPIWEEENAGVILDALIVEKNVMFILLFCIMIVAAFGIASALITFVVQKTREIGILKAVGASSGQIMWIFFSQSLLVGVVGVTIGLGTGMLALAYRNEFLFFLRRITGFELFPARIYNFEALPALVDPAEIAFICGGSLLICLLAGLFPAWNAGRLEPVEALRHE